MSELGGDRRSSPAAAELAATATRCGVGLLYHAVFDHIPKDIDVKLHNVTVSTLRRHLLALRRSFRIVSVDEFAEARSTRGLACLSFDDGYRSVFSHAMPVLLDLAIPFTIFINGATLEGRAPWRDKVRYLIVHGLVDDFVAVCDQLVTVAGKSFYRYSKIARNNSRVLDAALDRFLAARGVDLGSLNYCFDSTRYLVRDPLVSYGNHSHSHYLASSLSRHEQLEEIEKTHALLAAHPELNVSRLFSIPFGDEPDFNDDTLAIVRDLGYSGVLLSRGRVQTRPLRRHGLVAVERVMPRGDDLAALLATVRARSPR